MRRALVLLQLLALAVGLSACGGDTLSLDPVAEAATKTVDAGSSRIDFEMRMEAGDESFTFDGEGAFAYAPRVRGWMKMEMPEFFPGSGPGAIEMRMVGDKMFMRLTGDLMQDAGRGSGKTWFGFDLKAAMNKAGLGSFDLSQLQQQQNPSELLRLLRLSGTSVEQSGEAIVRGVRTTRYSAKLDLTKSVEAAADQLGVSKRERQEMLLAVTRLQAQTGLSEIPVEVYVDATGLLRRMVMTMSMKVEGNEMSMLARYDFFDFGVAVKVKAPPAKSVLDLTGELGP